MASLVRLVLSLFMVSNRVPDEGFSRFFHRIFLYRNWFYEWYNTARALVATRRGYADAPTKFSRAKPHMNIGTIGHVDHGKVVLVVLVPFNFLTALRVKTDHSDCVHYKSPR